MGGGSADKAEPRPEGTGDSQQDPSGPTPTHVNNGGQATTPTNINYANVPVEMDSGYTSESSQCTKNCQVDCISDIQPLFLSKASIETFFPTLKGGGRGSTKPAMLNTTYEDRCEEDAWPRFDQEGKLIGGTLRESFITNTVVHATRRMRSDKAYQPDFSFNCLTLIAWVRNPETGKRLKARVLLDDASTVTIMLRSTADRLGLGKNQPVSAEFSTTGGAQQRHEDEWEV